MIRVAVVLIAALLTACASAPPVSPLAARDWATLQTALGEAPPPLRQAIGEEAQARLAPAAAPRVPAGERALLLDLLAQAVHPALAPDAAFRGLHEVVAGENRQAQPYAAALTDYLLQPDFACQQPLYAAYFERRYARAAAPCRAAVPFAVITRYEGGQITWLDPRRVRSIHLLFAGQSSELASRFGHVALRLVVCPQVDASEEACDANLFEHVVLGFQAHIDELSLNTFKALAGDYRAYFFASPFMETYEQYAIGEFREIYSLPLRLDDTQRERMVRELADIHWRYAGKYNFFTRNCATMMQEALRQAWPAFAQDPKLQSSYLRPDSLFDAVRRSALAQGERLERLDLAERSGHFFSSTRGFYTRAVNEVRTAMSNPGFGDLEDYLKLNPVQRRLDRESDAPYVARLAGNAHLREAQILLEEYAILRSMRLMMMEAARYFEQHDLLARGETISRQLDAEHARVFNDCLLTPIRQQLEPVRRLDGVPAAAEVPVVDSGRLTRCDALDSRRLLLETITAVADPQSEQWQQLLALSRYWGESIRNLNLLKTM